MSKKKTDKDDQHGTDNAKLFNETLIEMLNTPPPKKEKGEEKKKPAK